MEQRAKDLASETTNVGRQAKDMIQEKTQAWMEKGKTASAAAAEKAQAAYRLAQSKAMEGAKVTDAAIRTNPYASLGVAFGAGLLIGFLVKRR